MFSIFWLLIFCLIFCTSVSDDSSISSFIVFVERSFDNIKKYLYSWFEIIAKIGIPSPHNFKGSNHPFCNCWHEFRRYNQVGLADQKCQVWSSWCMMVCVWMFLWSKSMQLEVLLLLSLTKPSFRLWVHQFCFQHFHVCI